MCRRPCRRSGSSVSSASFTDACRPTPVSSKKLTAFHQTSLPPPKNGSVRIASRTFWIDCTASSTVVGAAVDRLEVHRVRPARASARASAAAFFTASSSEPQRKWMGTAFVLLADAAMRLLFGLYGTSLGAVAQSLREGSQETRGRRLRRDRPGHRRRGAITSSRAARAASPCSISIPTTPAHLMIIPYRATGDLEDLGDDETARNDDDAQAHEGGRDRGVPAARLQRRHQPRRRRRRRHRPASAHPSRAPLARRLQLHDHHRAKPVSIPAIWPASTR